MAIVNVHQAKTQLSKLIARAERGEEIVIARNGKPAARLVRAGKERGERKPGLWRRKYPHLIPEFEKLADRIERPLPEDELKAWEK